MFYACLLLGGKNPHFLFLGFQIGLKKFFAATVTREEQESISPELNQQLRDKYGDSISEKDAEEVMQGLVRPANNDDDDIKEAQ